MTRLWDEAELGVAPSLGASGFDLADAYEIAGEVLRRREGAGWRRLGRKIGFTNREMMIRYGVDSPIFGYPYDHTLSDARDGPAALTLERLVQPLIEPEIVFKLLRSPPATSDPPALPESVEWPAQGFELAQCHFPDWILGAADAIADARSARALCRRRADPGGSRHCRRSGGAARALRHRPPAGWRCRRRRLRRTSAGEPAERAQHIW